MDIAQKIENKIAGKRCGGVKHVTFDGMDMFFAEWHVRNALSEEDLRPGGNSDLHTELICMAISEMHEVPDWVDLYFRKRREWVDANRDSRIQSPSPSIFSNSMEGIDMSTASPQDAALELVVSMMRDSVTCRSLVELIRSSQPDAAETLAKLAADVFRSKCNRHDLAYEYSDDSQVYRMGSESYRHLAILAGVLGDLVDCGQIFQEVAERKVKFPGMFPFVQPAGNGGAV